MLQQKCMSGSKIGQGDFHFLSAYYEIYFRTPLAGQNINNIFRALILTFLLDLDNGSKPAGCK